ncbi:MAG: Flp pilus assembly complex ATPase component TadA [Alphaproteobacteria bacterium]|nr:Flp pilus assembly complex ATPase component TadA [Alphaproteobacteria bacterium]
MDDLVLYSAGERDSTLLAAPIGQILVAHGFVSAGDLERGLAFQKRFGGRIGAVLVRIGALSESNLLLALSEQLGLPVLGSGDLPPDPAPVLAAMQRSGHLPEWWLDQEAIVWVNAADGTVCCVARDPLSSSLAEAVELAFGAQPVQWWLVPTQELDRMLDTVEQALRQERHNVLDEVSHLRHLAEEAPVVELVSNTLSQALGERASDIHVEPEERRFRIRYRIDGVLHTRLNQPRERYDAVGSRIKLLAGMDIAERRLPQDGRTTQRINGQQVDIRVSALPGTWGESLVLRLLPKERQQLHLEALGMAPDHRGSFSAAITEPNGILLVTGPTGSGKSTTLYAALEAINDGKKKIITAEDPVEYDIVGINQVQVHAEIGYSFARALRSILRQDPDIIMIGEIRDPETAQIAVQSSLTGHLVFSTLHTNDAISAFTRLVDMGVEPFLIAASLRMVIAQRLVRRLCARCAADTEPPSDQILAELQPTIAPEALDRARWRRSIGCTECQDTGYRGRVGIYEMVEVVEPLQEAILHRLPVHEVVEIARSAGVRSLRQDGLVKAAAGVTSVDEVMRVTGLKIAD